MSLLEKAKLLKGQLYTAYRALIDKRTPWYVRMILLFTIAYVLSPIDLIPDVIPVVGLLDDVILIPILIKLALGLLPQNLLQEYSSGEKSDEFIHSTKLSGLGLFLVCMVWIIFILILYAVIK